MSKYVLFLLMLLGQFANAALSAKDCMYIEGSINTDMTDAFTHDFGLSQKDFQWDATIMELVSENKTDFTLANHFATLDKIDYGEDFLGTEDIRKTFLGPNAKNLIIRFTYLNKEHKRNVFLASALIDDDECSIRFNGYIIVKREF